MAISKLSDREWLMKQYEKTPIEGIAKLVGVCRETVRKVMIKLRIPIKPRGRGKKSESHKTRMSEARKKYWENHTDRTAFKLKISASKTKTGISQNRKRVYVLGRGQVHDYRIAVEKQLGRLLKSDEYVHHIDGNSLNCDISNLTVMSPADHAALHSVTRIRSVTGRYA